MKRTTGEEGFSLLELTIAALLTVGLVGAIFSLLNRNQQVFINETGVTDLNQNMRTTVDLITRDVQSAGMGLSRLSTSGALSGTFAAVFYLNGTSGGADKIMITNGDPYAPSIKVVSSTSTQFVCSAPTDVTSTGTGSTTSITYLNASGTATPIYKSTTTPTRSYIVYDDKIARVMTLTANGQLNTAGTQLTLSYNSSASTYWSPASTFGCPIDTGTPTTSKSKIALLGSLIAYRLNAATHELERTEDLTNWYVVARGVLDFQVKYRIVTGQDSSGNDIDSLVDEPTTRANIRSVTFNIRLETPDLQPKDKGYRFAAQTFDVAPRNLNLVNNLNISAPIN
ncbi:MAG TPA: hypothetical protein VLR90_16180 [Blastocatellia bacterium]|nr:hypothetical protein [Blastocatellia bacterium]